jgi:Carboxypeptidase regulatory-like domain
VKLFGDHASRKRLMKTTGKHTTPRPRHMSLKAFYFPAFSALLLASMVLTQSSPAQNRNAGEIRGTVVDSSGATIPGVSVDAVNTATGIHSLGKTGDAGDYDLPYVESGDYTITFTKENFQKFVQTGIALHVATITINATLQVGSVSSQVTVAATPPLLQTETSELSTVMTQESVTELPNVGQNWQSYVDLIPGASPGSANSVLGVPGGGQGENVAINGGQEFQASWLIDGGVATLPISYNPANLAPPEEAIAEIDTTTSNFGAESGNGLVTFNAITRSGTNRFHGSLQEFVQNTIFNAAPRNWSSAPETKPPTHWNQYGGAIGGPIVRDKLFFFFAYQANPISTAITSLYTYPTDAVRAGNFSGFSTIYNPATTTPAGNTFTRQPFANNQLTSIDPVAAAIQKYFPEPNAINPNDPNYNNYYFSGVSPLTERWYDWKVDGNLSPKNHAYISGLYTNENQFSPTPDCPIDCVNDNFYELAAQLTDTWIISPSKLNELRVGVAREAGKWATESLNKGYPAAIGLPDLPANTFPEILATTGPSISIGNSAVNAKLGETAVSLTDTFNWILGKHTIKFGGEYDDWEDSDGWDTINAGTFNFGGIATRDPNSNDPSPSPGVGYADFLLGATNSWSVSEPIEFGAKEPNLQLFAQDAYKIFPNLTLNFGARYIYQVGWKDEHLRSGNYDPTLLNPATSKPGAIGFAGVQLPDRMEGTASFFAPRVGFSYSPRSNWTIRGGYGLYAVPWSGNQYAVGVGLGFNTQGASQSTDELTPVFQLAAGPPAPVVSTPATRTPSLLNGQSISYSAYHLPISYFEQWQFGPQRQFGNYVVNVNYVGSRGVKVFFGTDINQVPEGQLGSGVRPNPTYQNINADQYIGTSNYNGLQIQAKRQFKSGFSFLANYTWSKSMDTGTSGGGNNVGLDSWQDAYSTAANYAASRNDIRNLFNGYVLYDLPFGRGRTFVNRGGVADALVGGWQVSTIFRYNSGGAFTPLMSNNLSGALSGSWFPNRTGTTAVANRNVNEWFNVEAFSQPAPNTFGDSRRNILYGPRFGDVDLALAKSFAMPKLGEASSLQFKIESFDALNHPNYALPNSSIGSAGAGTISSNLTNRQVQVGGIFKF